MRGKNKRVTNLIKLKIQRWENGDQEEKDPCTLAQSTPANSGRISLEVNEQREEYMSKEPKLKFQRIC